MRSGAAATPGSGQGSGGFRRWGSKGFRCRWLMRFRGVSRAEGSGADGWWGSGGFRGRWLSGGFWRRLLMRFRRVLVQMADEVPESRGADSRLGCGGFRCRWLMRLWRVPGQIGASWWGSKRLRCRWLMRFRRVWSEMADEVLEGSGAESWWGSGEFRPESSGADSQKLSKTFQAVGDNAWVYFNIFSRKNIFNIFSK